MNMASRELSKELYELSGWEPSDWQHGIENGQPLYDLGYLLRKLPDEATSKKHGGYHYFYMHHNSQFWYAYYGEIDTTELMATADTPEDAACKLAIELFEQGILT